jgi:hypothetical protein
MVAKVSLLFIVSAAVCARSPAQSQAAAVPAASQPGHKIIWIVGAGGTLSAYDTTDFRLWNESDFKLPYSLQGHPENISAISKSGLVFYIDADRRPQIWNLRSASELALPPEVAADKAAPATGNGIVTIAEPPQVYPSADGQRLFWFQNRMSVQRREGQGDISRTGEFLAWTTDVDGRNARRLAQIPFAPCKCETAVCEETCPEISAWTPPSGVSDFFYLSRFIQGQLSEQDVETDLYQATNGSWKVTRLPKAVHAFLDARDQGNAYIGTIPDAGCCGWENESDNQTYLASKGLQTTFFDEFSRFHNQDYDVSFLTSNARFSPDGAEIAYTITSIFMPGQPIRIADSGTEKPEELRQIQKVLTSLPMVEVVALDNLSSPLVRLANAQLIGWLDARLLLVWQDGQLLILETTTRQLTEIGLKASKPADVFIN